MPDSPEITPPTSRALLTTLCGISFSGLPLVVNAVIGLWIAIALATSPWWHPAAVLVVWLLVQLWRAAIRLACTIAAERPLPQSGRLAEIPFDAQVAIRRRVRTIRASLSGLFEQLTAIRRSEGKRDDVVIPAIVLRGTMMRLAEATTGDVHDLAAHVADACDNFLAPLRQATDLPAEEARSFADRVEPQIRQLGQTLADEHIDPLWAQLPDSSFPDLEQ